MTKALRLLLVILSVSVLLIGCTRSGPIKVPDVTSAPAEETTTPTQAPTEAPTEATQPSVPALTAPEVYKKMHEATKGARANQFTQISHSSVRVGADGVFVRTETTNTKRVVLTGMPCTVNVETETFAKSMDMEIEQLYHEYYRLEDGKMVLYYYIDTLDMYGKEVLEFDPYDVLLSFSVAEFSYLKPDNLAMAEETVELDGRQTYMLTYTIPLMYFTGATGDAQTDALLETQNIPHTCYVDTETFLPLQLETSFSDIGDELADLILSTYGNVYVEDMENTEVQISELTVTVKDLIFDPVEVPDIPQQVLDGIGESSNYASV